MLVSGRIPQKHSQSGAQMEVSGHYVLCSGERVLHPQQRLGGPTDGLDVEQTRNTSVAAGNLSGRVCPLIDEDDQCSFFTLNMAVCVQVQQGI